MTDDTPRHDPVHEPMPDASKTPVSTVTPLVSPVSQEARTYKGRFAAVYAGLGALLLAGAVVFAILVGKGGKPAGAAWAPFKPSGDTALEQAESIASHIAPRYRLGQRGAQLVSVQAQEPEVQNIPVARVALKGDSASDDYKVVSTKDSLVYVLCGLGERCSIATGKPSAERARLLRREALELALYTFKYADGVESVIALIPPPANDERTNWALFFEKKNFAKELSKPLGQTLPTPTAGRKLVPASVVGNQDERTIEKLTQPYWFTSEFVQQQDGNAALVLAPVIVPR